MEATKALANLREEDQQLLLPVVPSVDKGRALYPTGDTLTVMERIALNVLGVSILPKGMNERAAFFVQLVGYDIGVPPAVALSHIFLINGRVMLSAQLMMGLCLANDASVEFDWVEISSEKVVLRLWRGQGERRKPTEVIYTRQDAERAGQWQQKTRKPVIEWGERNGKRYPKEYGPEEPYDGPWQTHPHLMLAYNAARTAIKLRCPDLVNGIVARMPTPVEAAAVYQVEDAPAESPLPAPEPSEVDELILEGEYADA